jgi:hypothetical protein
MHSFYKGSIHTPVYVCRVLVSQKIPQNAYIIYRNIMQLGTDRLFF